MHYAEITYIQIWPHGKSKLAANATNTMQNTSANLQAVSPSLYIILAHEPTQQPYTTIAHALSQSLCSIHCSSTIILVQLRLFVKLLGRLHHGVALHLHPRPTGKVRLAEKDTLLFPAQEIVYSRTHLLGIGDISASGHDCYFPGPEELSLLECSSGHSLRQLADPAQHHRLLQLTLIHWFHHYILFLYYIFN